MKMIKVLLVIVLLIILAQENQKIIFVKKNKTNDMWKWFKPIFKKILQIRWIILVPVTKSTLNNVSFPISVFK